MMEALGSSKTSVYLNDTAWRSILEGCIIFEIIFVKLRVVSKNRLLCYYVSKRGVLIVAKDIVDISSVKKAETCSLICYHVSLRLDYYLTIIMAVEKLLYCFHYCECFGEFILLLNTS